jgi:enediyne polyketide synthase
MTCPIAIVGMACRYPDAKSPAELWENVLAQRRAFRRLPPERLRVEDYFSSDRNAPDRTYAAEAALIEGYEFDREKFKVVGSTFRSADLAHWLALDIAARALEDAGFSEGRGLPVESTGVVLGNTLTGEFSRANLMRYRWPYVRRTLDATLQDEGWPAAKRRTFLETLEARYKSPFPPVGEESLAGGLSNTIAGRICNHFDFKGGGYTVDGACASSLLAVTHACAALASEDLDVALAGGVDLSLDPFEIVGFAKAGALAADEMRVYDVRAEGFWPGEGCGFVVLMRYDDALAQGRRVYATIRGWGVSSDGSGGITRPEEEGQLLALRRAYRRAGFGIETVGYFEGHGTGTVVGDATELKTLSRARREAAGSGRVPPACAASTGDRLRPELRTVGNSGVGPLPREEALAGRAVPLPAAAVIGSIKANIGHTKAAAGVAGVIKATLALHTQLLPPTTGCLAPCAELAGSSAALRVAREAELWPSDLPLRAAVSSMGFGGINAHVVLEGVAAERRRRLTSRECALWRSAQDAEAFLLAGSRTGELCEQVERLLSFAARLSRGELADLAAELARRLVPNELRAAVIASKPGEFELGLRTLRSWLKQGITNRLDLAAGVFLGDRTAQPRIGFLFPGQGSPAHLDGGLYRRRFATVDELYAAHPLPAQSDGVATNVAQPAIVTASLAGLRVLRGLGIEASIGIGHSLGELTAYHWSGAFDEAGVLRIAAARGGAMAELGDPTGAMASLEADETRARALLNGEWVGLAALNSPRQTVISGPAHEVATVVERAHAAGLRALRLAVSHAFHSPLVAAATPALARHLSGEPVHPLRRPVASTITGTLLPANVDLRDLLCRQVTHPVRFLEAVQAAARSAPPSPSSLAPGPSPLASAIDLWLEVGPGDVLTGLLRDIVETPAIALDAGGPSLRGLFLAVGAAFTLGVPIQHRNLFEGRFTRPFSLDWHPKFFVNPCELAPVSETSEAAATLEQHVAAPKSELDGIAVAPADSPIVSTTPPPLTQHPAPNTQHASPLALVRQLVAARAELPVRAIKDDSRMLSDLHLNSISVGQLVAEAARRLGLPPLLGLTEFANASVARIAQALEEIARTGGGRPAEEHKRPPAGVDSWIRAFTVESIEAPLRPGNANRQELEVRPRTATERSGAWQVLAPVDHPLTTSLRETFARADGAGVIVCLPVAPSLSTHGGNATVSPQCSARTAAFENTVRLLLEGARAVLAMKDQPRFVLVQHGWSAGGFARTLHLENPEIPACVVDVPAQHPQAAHWVRDEALAATGYAEAHYDLEGRRREPRLKLLPLEEPSAPLPLGRDDVLLVTGGGKGIAAECALSLARETGVRLALLGRSEPDADAELRANLQRFDAAGIRWRYFSADVTDLESTRLAIVRAQSELGPVTALLHGAGANVPRLISALDEAACRQTLAPKILGLRNVLAALSPDRLKLLISFGSIIARAGLPGEADYALANEWLAALTERFHAEHPHCRCLTIEWSVWSGVGMGQRLGRVETLMQHGITPIPPDRGVEILLQLLRRPFAACSVVVSGRFGEPPTLKLERPELPLLRFLEHPRVFYPGVELVVDAELASETDPHLEDHVYHGERLLAAVLGLEAMAQVAMALAGSRTPPSFSEVQLSRPVVVAKGRKTRIRVAALARRPGEVEVVLRSEETGFQVDHFRAVCCFARVERGVRSASCQLPVVSCQSGSDESQNGNQQLATDNWPLPLALDPARDLYGELLFHTGRFQRLRSFRVLRAKECVAEIELRGGAWFGRYLPPDLVLGDPGARDAAIHAIQACIPHQRLLPVGIERIVVESPGMARATDPVFVKARERSHAGTEFVYDLEILSTDGAMLERWQGLRLRVVEPLKRRRPWPAALLGPYLERRLAELAPGTAAAVTLVHEPSLQRHQRSEAAIRRLLGPQAEVGRRIDGKPESDGLNNLSTAHTGDLTLAVSGEVSVSCDLEQIGARPSAAWQDLLGTERFQLAELLTQEAGEALDAAATRVWAASECLVKAGLPLQAPLVFDSSRGEECVVLRAGEWLVVTFVVAVRDTPGKLAAGVLLRRATSEPAARPRPAPPAVVPV